MGPPFVERAIHDKCSQLINSGKRLRRESFQDGFPAPGRAVPPTGLAHQWGAVESPVGDGIGGLELPAGEVRLDDLEPVGDPIDGRL
jgi:hypothetical protein